VNELFLYEAEILRIGTPESHVLCKGALGPLRAEIEELQDQSRDPAAQATKMVSVSLEVNGIALGKASELGAQTSVFILPSLAQVRARGTTSQGDQEEFLSGSLDLYETTIMNQEMAETGLFACVYTINDSVASMPLASD
jgi:hypothetical protein